MTVKELETFIAAAKMNGLKDSDDVIVDHGNSGFTHVVVEFELVKDSDNNFALCLGT